MTNIIKSILIALIALVLAYSFFLVFSKPSNDKQWSADQSVLPYAVINGDNITVYNVRNFKYTSAETYDPSYYDRTYDIKKLDKVDFVFVPFKDQKYAAHTFLTFGFDNGDYLAVSIEIRKKKGDKYSVIKGLFNSYEIMYVIADERDAIRLRSNFRLDDVFIYPAKASVEKKREVFIDMLKRANKLKDHPEFYNTIINSCSSNIMRHMNTVAPRSVPFSYKVFISGFADELAFDLGMIDTALPFEKAEQIFLINERARKCGGCPDFSQKIRAHD